MQTQRITGTIGAAGRLVIPAEMRKALDLRPGRRVVLQVRGDVLEVSRAVDALERSRRIARAHPLPKGARRLSDSLIRDRRAAAARGD